MQAAQKGVQVAGATGHWNSQQSGHRKKATGSMQAALKVCRLQGLTGLAGKVQGHLSSSSSSAKYAAAKVCRLQEVDRAFKDRFKATCIISAAVLQLFPAKPKVW